MCGRFCADRVLPRSRAENRGPSGFERVRIRKKVKVTKPPNKPGVPGKSRGPAALIDR